jgi:hypothetical protein
MGKFAHKGLAGFMALWLSGIVFLLCCELPKAEAAPADSCPLARMKGHCDKAKNAPPLLTLSNLPDTGEADCCGFIPAVFDKARKIQKIEPVAHTETAVMSAPPAAFAVQNTLRTVSVYRSNVANGKRIFIKNCVFRI